MKTFGLQKKLFVFTTGLLLVMVIASTSINTYLQQKIITQWMAEKAENTTQWVSSTITDSLAALELNKLKWALEDVAGKKRDDFQPEEDPDVAYAYIFDGEGRILTDGTSENWLRDKILTDPMSQRSIQAKEMLIQRTPEVIDITVPVFLSDKKIGGARLGFSMNRVKREIERIRNHNLMVGGIFLLLSLILTYFLSIIITRPLQSLMTSIHNVGSGKWDDRVNIQTDDEFGRLGEAFNRMISDLQMTTVSRDSLLKEIEERKKLEKMVLQSEKMAAVGQLAGGVAHEINNPLGVILGFAQGVVKRLPPGDALEMPLKSIEREALRCKHLVQDLLTFSRVGQSEKEPTDINQMIEGSLSLILAQAKIKNVEFTKYFDPNLPLTKANKNQLQQVIVNLANNAMDAMPNGGNLTIRTKKKTLKDKPVIEIEVQDTGQGIPHDILNKIFEPFFTTKDVGKGTGLGLSLVFEIIQKHDGVVEVNSTVGTGTVFRIFLPIG
jgi:signal transduction histidine kinase